MKKLNHVFEQKSSSIRSCKKVVRFGASPASKTKEIDKVSKNSLHYQDLSKKCPQRLLIAMLSLSVTMKGGLKMRYVGNFNRRAKR